MAERRFRAQILLEPEQHRRLTEIAREEHRSLSDLVREMVQHQLTARDHEDEIKRRRRLAALEEIERHRQSLLRARGGKPLDIDVVELVAEMREERDAEVTGDSGPA